MAIHRYAGAAYLQRLQARISARIEQRLFESWQHFFIHDVSYHFERQRCVVLIFEAHQHRYPAHDAVSIRLLREMPGTKSTRRKRLNVSTITSGCQKHDVFPLENGFFEYRFGQ